MLESWGDRLIDEYSGYGICTEYCSIYATVSADPGRHLLSRWRIGYGHMVSSAGRREFESQPCLCQFGSRDSGERAFSEFRISEAFGLTLEKLDPRLREIQVALTPLSRLG